MGKAEDTLGSTLMEAAVPSALRPTEHPDAKAEDNPIERAARGLNRLADTTKKTLRVVYWVAVIVVLANVLGFVAMHYRIERGLLDLARRFADEDALQRLRDTREEARHVAREQLAESLSLSIQSRMAVDGHDAERAKAEADEAAIAAQIESAKAERVAIETKIKARKITKRKAAPEAPQQIEIVKAKVERLQKKAAARKRKEF